MIRSANHASDLKDDEGLCCCEYIGENGEKEHMLATFCNCEAIDEACERLVSWKGNRPGLSTDIKNAIVDRVRIPWPGGARKFSLPVILPLILNPYIIVAGSMSKMLTFVTYIVLLPAVVYCCHRFMKRRRKMEPINGKLLSENGGGNSNDFYMFWLVSTVVYLMLIYYTLVINSLKISSLENLVFVVFFVCTCACLFVVVKKGRPSAQRNKKKCSRSTSIFDTSPSGKICSQGCFGVCEDSQHCKICDACFSQRDHHCLWLNTCIGHVNDRWFFSGLVFALSCLLYFAQLTLTTVCHPRFIDMYFLELMYPHRCPNAYLDFGSSLMISGGCYAVVIAGCVTLVLIQQVCAISRGSRRPDVKKRLNRSSALCRICMNWYQFWRY